MRLVEAFQKVWAFQWRFASSGSSSVAKLLECLSESPKYVFAKKGTKERSLKVGEAVSTRLLLRAYRRFERCNPQIATALGILLVLACLEFSTPPFFFGDDNMQFTFVQMTEMAKNLVHGENLFINHHIFGGDFDMRRDPVFLSLWNPLTVFCSLLTLTRWKFWAVDLLVGVWLLATGAAMVRLIVLSRELKYLRLSNTLVAFLSASYACSGFSLGVVASWGMYAPNIAALPMFLIGVIHPRTVRGIAWVCFAVLIGLLAGTVDGLSYSFVFVTLFCGFVAWRQRSIKPLVVMATGVLLAVLISSPLLWPAWRGFQTTHRAAGMTGVVGSAYRYQLPALVAGYFTGWFAHWFAEPVRITFFQHPWVPFFFSFSFSSTLAFVAFRHWKKRGFFSQVPLLLAIVAILLVVRPLFLDQLIAHVPVFRYLKMPFRQLMFFQFFIVLWLAFNLGRLPARDGIKLMACGVVIFVLSLIQLRLPYFTDFGDRSFILSGRAARFYEEVRRDMPADSVLATVGDSSSWFFKYPIGLAGGNNFPALFGIPMATGYSPTKPLDSDRTRIPADPFFGFVDHAAVPLLLRTYPKLYVIELAPHACVRMGAVDSRGAFIDQPKTINFAVAVPARGQTSEGTFLEPAPSNPPAFTNATILRVSIR